MPFPIIPAENKWRRGPLLALAKQTLDEGSAIFAGIRLQEIFGESASFFLFSQFGENLNLVKPRRGVVRIQFVKLLEFFNGFREASLAERLLCFFELLQELVLIAPDFGPRGICEARPGYLCQRWPLAWQSAGRGPLGSWGNGSVDGGRELSPVDNE